MSVKSKSGHALHFASNKVSLYHQLATILREQILSGQYSPDDQLPTETELVAEYGVSRITVRQALRNLEEEQLVRREAGRGTFVTGNAPIPKTLRMNGSLDDLISMGLATSVKLLDLAEVVATKADAKALDVPVGTALVQCKRLRYYHKEPYSYIINRLPTSIADRFEDHDWEEGAILQSLEQRLGLHLGDADQQVGATLADAALARLLKTRIGAPLLSVDRVVRTDTGQAVEHVHTYYRADLYSLTVHLTRDPSRSRPAHSWTLKNSSET
jgi:GntR family transcriptional regulator